MKFAAAFIYWPIVVIWLGVFSTIIVFYFKNPKMYGNARLLLTVLAIDTLRNLVENVYFGLYFGGQYGFFSQTMVTVLGQPALLIVPKLLNVASGCTVLSILLLHWLPSQVRERQAAESTAESLREIASHDGLTGLFNRSQFGLLGEAEWQRMRRYGRPLSMLMLDIDLFKRVNDENGHDVGDVVIQQVAAVCRDLPRKADVAARLGGEEFAIMLPETGWEAACVLAERLRQATLALCVISKGKHVRVSVSIGVAGAEGLPTFSALVKAADVALYEAKRTGRNRICSFASIAEMQREAA